jgi:hypothetical protein
MNMNMINEIGSSIKRIAAEAIIRSGDYPRERRSLDITLILSELTNVGRIMEYFAKAIRYISYKKKWEGLEYEQRGIEDAFRDIPSLL